MQQHLLWHTFTYPDFYLLRPGGGEQSRNWCPPEEAITRERTRVFFCGVRVTPKKHLQLQFVRAAHLTGVPVPEIFLYCCRTAAGS